MLAKSHHTHLIFLLVSDDDNALHNLMENQAKYIGEMFVHNKLLV